MADVAAQSPHGTVNVDGGGNPKVKSLPVAAVGLPKPKPHSKSGGEASDVSTVAASESACSNSKPEPSVAAKRARDDGMNQALSGAKWRAIESERASCASDSADTQNRRDDIDIDVSVLNCERESPRVAGQGECLYGGKPHPHPLTP